jgi:hypothetical protein
MKTLAFFSTLLLLLACKREAPQPIDQLPPATQEGANTFGCLVDGEVWLPESDSWLDVPWTASYSNGLSYLIFSATDEINDSGFRFSFPSDFGTSGLIRAEGTYELIYVRNQRYIYFRKGNTFYRPDSTYNGALTITKLDTLEGRFVSGTFYFDAVNENDSTDIVQITDGRFDLKF